MYLAELVRQIQVWPGQHRFLLVMCSYVSEGVRHSLYILFPALDWPHESCAPGVSLDMRVCPIVYRPHSPIRFAFVASGVDTTGVSTPYRQM